MFFARWSHRGRHWVLFGSLVLEGVALLAFSTIGSAYFARAIIVLVIFSTFVQMAEGAEFAMLPSIGRSTGAPGAVSGFVSSGGNIGAVLFMLMHTQYGNMDADPREAYRVHGIIVICISCLVPCLHWSQFGSMFFPAQAAKVFVVGSAADSSYAIAVEQLPEESPAPASFQKPGSFKEIKETGSFKEIKETGSLKEEAKEEVKEEAPK
jgi:Na+/melibiose symporter-like transporter